VVSRADAIAPTDLYAQLLSFEQHTSLHVNSRHDVSLSTMTTSHDRGFSGGRSPGPPSCGSGCGRGRGSTQHGGYPNQLRRGTNNSNNSSTNWPQCHVCSKIGHTAKTCYYCYEDDSNIESCTTGMAASVASSAIDNNWYTNSGGTDHITGDLDKLTMYDTYGGHDQIHAENGSGMNITHIGTSIIATPTRTLTLNNVMHIPSTHKNLISVHRFTLHNDIFIEFHPYFFLIKDQKTRNVLLHGRCKGGLYPLPSLGSKF
jgi:hypothetical protein